MIDLIFLMRRRQPISTHTDILFPYTKHFLARSYLPVFGVCHRLVSRHDPLAITVLYPRQQYVRHYLNSFRREPAISRLVKSEEHTSELQSLMRNSYSVFCLTKKSIKHTTKHNSLYTLSNYRIFLDTQQT